MGREAEVLPELRCEGCPVLARATGSWHIASVSWGKDSLAMLLNLIERREPLDEVVFFDTGMEYQAIYDMRDKALPLLDRKGIAASSGSACTSGSLDPSHVLLAIGLPHEVAHGSLRLSVGEYNTDEEMAYIVDNVRQVVAYLRSISPVWDELETGARPHLI